MKKTVAQPQPQSGADKPDPAPLVRYEVTPTDIRAMAKRFSALTADTREGYESVRGAIATLRNTRVAVEKRRVELKASALAYGRRVDAIADELTVALESIEEPLKLKKAAVDDERDRVRREKEAVEKAAVEAAIRAERETEEARLKTIRDAEEARLKVLREAEEARLAVERAQLAAERRQLEEAHRIERDRLAAERIAREEEAQKVREAEAAQRAVVERELAEARAQLAVGQRAVEQERKRLLEEADSAKRAEEANAKVERDRVAAEEQAARLEALKPDIAKVLGFRVAILALVSPTVSAPEAVAVIARAVDGLSAVAVELARFGGKQAP